MKTATKVILAITAVLIWITSLFIFVPYDMKTVVLPNESPNDFFNTKSNYLLSNVMEKHFENSNEIIALLENKTYKCLSEDEIFEILLKESGKNLTGYTISDTLMSLSCFIENNNVSQVTFFEHDDSCYVLFILSESEKDTLRILPTAYTIFSTDSFEEELKNSFFTSSLLINKPSSFTAIEAMMQSGIITVIYIVIFVIIALVFSTIQYKKEKAKQKFTNDDTTSSSDIKKYICKKFGEELFSDEKLTRLQCITIDTSNKKAKEFICNLTKKYDEDEIFIGSFFENSNYIDDDSTLVTYIKEYLDENSYSSINYPENEAVIGWIIDGNNAEETSVSFYMQNLNILIYPVKQKLYIFCKDSNDTFAKLIDVANDVGLTMSASN